VDYAIISKKEIEDSEYSRESLQIWVDSQPHREAPPKLIPVFAA
jgi:hypothetical protein